jgi:hypothetical protein
VVHSLYLMIHLATQGISLLRIVFSGLADAHNATSLLLTRKAKSAAFIGGSSVAWGDVLLHSYRARLH